MRRAAENWRADDRHVIASGQRKILEEKFSKAFQSSPDAVLIARIGNDRRREVNDGFMRLTGYRRDEVLGKPIHAINLLSDSQTYADLIAAMGPQGVIRERGLTI